ncbi:MAG: ATP-binding protein [Chitinivibrionales bacterium]
MDPTAQSPHFRPFHNKKIDDARFLSGAIATKHASLQTLVATSPFAVAFVDDNDIITDCTAPMAALCDQISTGNLRGRKIENLISQKQRREFKDFIRAVPAQPASVKKQFHLNVSSGKLRTSIIHASRWIADDQTSGLILSFEIKSIATENALNESEQRFRQVELEKQHIQAQLRQSQKMEAVGRLAGGIAHDFNNLLMAITGYSDLLLKRIGNSPHRKDVEEIGSAGRRAAAITHQLLAFSRRQNLRTTVLDLSLLVEDMQSLLGHLIGEDIALKTQLGTEQTRVKADAAQIEQVLLNLAVNARDAMPNGGKLYIGVENVYITEDACRHIPDASPGEKVCLTFRDTGAGIDDSILESIFEPFFSTKDDGKGTGLGLSVVYGIIKQHNGWIQVKSDHNSGTVFSIYLPGFTMNDPVDSHHPDDLKSLRGNGENILLVEDEESVRNFAKRALHENGYRVITACNAAEAEKQFNQNHDTLDLLFSDVVLPDTAGVDLVRRLQRKNPHTKILLTSGYPDEKAQLQLIHKCGYSFLPKPYFLAELLQGVKKALMTPPESGIRG